MTLSNRDYSPLIESIGAALVEARETADLLAAELSDAAENRDTQHIVEIAAEWLQVTDIAADMATNRAALAESER